MLTRAGRHLQKPQQQTRVLHNAAQSSVYSNEGRTITSQNYNLLNYRNNVFQQQFRGYAKAKKGKGAGLANLAKGVYYKKNKKTLSKPKSSLPDESTPELFEHNLSHDYILSLNIDSATQREALPVPEQDFTKFDNATWKKQKRRETTMKLLEATELYPDLFPEADRFLPQLRDALSVNLRVSYGEDFYDNAMLGNFLEAEKTLKAPQVEFPLDGEAENSMYTMVMITPDYPFRLDSDGAPMVHWMVSNIPGNNVSQGNTLVDYLPPLPTEYAGTFRYVFLLYRQPSKLELGEKIEDLNDRRNFSIHKLADSFALGLPVGMSFFRTEYDFCVTEQYREMDRKEPYYIPPDLRARHEVQSDLRKMRHFSGWNI